MTKWLPLVLFAIAATALVRAWVVANERAMRSAAESELVNPTLHDIPDE